LEETVELESSSKLIATKLKVTWICLQLRPTDILLFKLSLVVPGYHCA